MKPALLLCFLLLAVPAHARLGETTQQIEARYGKPIRATKPESPATDAQVYEKNGFRITVGYYEGKSYYEQYQKIDPKNPNLPVEISETERNWLAKANGLFPENDKYISWDKLSEGRYTLFALTIRSLRVEKQREAEEKKWLEENLKEF
jgi:hypothetical protein